MNFPLKKTRKSRTEIDLVRVYEAVNALSEPCIVVKIVWSKSIKTSDQNNVN